MAERDQEFVRRAGFALMAMLAVHDKVASDQKLSQFFFDIERYADDNRNFVKKAVNWALRQIGKRNPALRERAVVVSQRLILCPEPSARWIGRDALRELTKQ